MKHGSEGTQGGMCDKSSQQMETGDEVGLELASSGKARGMAPLIRHAQPKGSVADSELSNLLRSFWPESHPSQHLVEENTGKRLQALDVDGVSMSEQATSLRWGAAEEEELGTASF